MLSIFLEALTSQIVHIAKLYEIASIGFIIFSVSHPLTGKKKAQLRAFFNSLTLDFKQEAQFALTVSPGVASTLASSSLLSVSN